MKTRKSLAWWNRGLMLVLLCLCSLPQLATGGNAPPIPTGPLDQNGMPATPDYYTTANWANSPPLAKFVDSLPGLGSAKANNLGQYLSIAKPDVTSYPGSDYYEIELVQYRERMHSDLPAPGTLLRGYQQVNRGTNLAPGTLPSQNLCGNDRHPCTAADTSVSGIQPDTVHYLGPNIIAERDRPVRIKFTNKLPVGEAGKLFIPVDTSVMGAGTGPLSFEGMRGEGMPCDNTMEPGGMEGGCASYTENRAVIHLHGGRTPWISDGTPHQWITPAEEMTPFAHGASLVNVPDMPDPGDGSATYYFTNAQSARLMFYHDHSFGITRLNVYAGEAAGYLITDKYEQDLVARGIIPPDQIPLIIQDKTFVDATPTPHPVSGVITPKVRITDPLWNWGSGPLVDGVRTPVTGDLWLPHVYMPAQTLAAGFGGVNPFGRWMYGPWFYPATAVEKGPVPNPYYDADCSSTNPVILAQCQTPGQPTMIPGTPNVSMGMEAFQDSAVVNGTVFPTLTVDPRAYRFRILNAASDRFFNLSFYQADPAQLSPDARLLAPGRSNRTEVKMLPASAELAEEQGWPELWPVDGRDGGVPDPALRGPNFLQIGSEGGFLPKPVEIEPQPIVYFTDPTAFWVGTVDKMGLALGPAERADVIVDFSQFAGKTLILYNDAPAAWPARVPGYDYFTGAEDLRDSGGYGTGGTFNFVTGAWEGGSGPLVGYAPNTRTVMQIIVRQSAGTDPAYSFNRENLEKEFTADAPVTPVNPAPTKTLFERAQEPIIVGQAAYQDVYPASYFPTNYPWEGVSQINDDYLKFLTLDGKQVEAYMEPKGIHDEMGASFDPVYGRMSGNLAMQRPNPTTLNALLILYGFSDLPTETVNNSLELNVQVVPGTTTLADGTQIWKISHNGVDTHPIHFHIFDVQVVNRVGWDGQILMPEPNELGWKDTVKVSPLMDTIVAVRPRAPALPFGIPNSVRLLNPTIPEGSGMGFNSVDWTTGERRPEPVTNVEYDFGWEYVWHCHILSHEEMDMMRPIVLKVATDLPPAFAAKAALDGGDAVVTWNDPTPVSYSDPSTFGNPANEIGFNVYRSSDGATFDQLNDAPLLANSTSYTDTTAAGNAAYIYKVEAFNASGSTFAAPAGLLQAAVSVTNGPAFSAPATVNLSATVTPLAAGATVTQVAFYNGATLIGIAPTPGETASFSWTGVPKGTYSVTARVTDSRGGITISDPITVTVSGALSADFTVTGSSSGPDLGYCETLSFNSAASTGAVTGYNWLINGTNFGTATVNTSLAIGSYPVTLAITNSGTGETTQVTKTVNVVNHNPIANAGGPYTVRLGENLTLNGSGSDPADPCNTALSYAWNIDNRGDYDLFTANPTLSYNTLRTVLGVGIFTITFRVTDASGGVGTATATVTVTAPVPTGSIVINGGAGTTITAQVTLALSASPEVTQMQFSKDGGATWYGWENFATTRSVTLAPTGDGLRSISVRFRDAAGTVSAVYSDSITLSTTGPTGSVSINGGAPSTSTLGATLTLAASGSGATITQMQLSKDGGATWYGWENYVTSRSIQLAPAGEGTKSISVRFRDSLGRVSPLYSDTITVITTPPTGSVSINSSATYCTSQTVTLTLSANSVAGVTGMRFSKDGGTTWFPWESFAPTRNITLTAGGGVKEITVLYRDSAGNVSAAYADTIIYDALPPTGSIVINGGASSTGSLFATLALSAADANGVTQMQFSKDGVNWYAWEPYSTTRNVTLTSGAGEKSMYVRFKDGAGRISASFSDSIDYAP